MKPLILEKLRECCDNSKSFLVVYDGAETRDLPILVCDVCFNELSFQKYIVVKYKLSKKSNIKEILKNHLQN